MFRPSRRARADRVRAIRETARRAAAHGTGRYGPPAVALARDCFRDSAVISFDPLETQCVCDADGVRVRAWVQLPLERISAAVRTSLAISARGFGDEPLLARIFWLSSSYGLSVDDIAMILGTRPRRVRRLLLHAIARLDPGRLPLSNEAAGDADDPRTR